MELRQFTYVDMVAAFHAADADLRRRAVSEAGAGDPGADP